MLPRWHILLGLLFSLLIWLIFPKIWWFYILIIFLSSFLIDFDHYIVAVIKTKKLGLFDAFEFYNKTNSMDLKEHRSGLRKKRFLHIFHTIEFHILILFLGLIHEIFIYIFIGMIFHSIIDFIDLTCDGMLYKREYFLTRWLIKNL